MLISKKTSCFVPGCKGEMKYETFPPATHDFIADGTFRVEEYKPSEVFAQYVCTTCNAQHKMYAARKFNNYPWHSYHFPNGLVRVY